MKYFIQIGVMLLLLVSVHPGYADETEDLLHQASTFSILEQGGYYPVITVGGMAIRGDQGIGGFEDLNGELVQINGTIYQITADGVVSVPQEDEGIAFMNTIMFNPEWNVQLTEPMNLTVIEEELAASFPTDDRIYAIRVDGTFSKITVRSVPGQEEPYPPLSSVIANQSIFNLTDTPGSIIGFWFPDWMKGVHVAGYHLHFISDDRTAGGHLLSCDLKEGEAMIDPIHSFRIDHDLIEKSK